MATSTANQPANPSAPPAPTPSGASFHDLPSEIRNEIYRLATFDRDRAVVFLPRAVKRRVTEETDEDVQLHWLEPHSNTHDIIQISFPGNEGRSKASGVYFDEDLGEFSEDERASEFGSEDGSEDLSIEDSDDSTEEQPSGSEDDATDEQTGFGEFADRLDWAKYSLMSGPEMSKLGACLNVNDNLAAWRKVEGHLDAAEKQLIYTADERLCGGEPADDEDDMDLSKVRKSEEQGKVNSWRCDAATSEEPCYCYCHVDNACNEPKVRVVDEEGFIVPLEKCMKNECEDESCEHCGGDSLYFDSEDETWYINDLKEDGLQSDEEIEEDDEHVNMDNETGVLYNGREPDILLTSREIREQCLPIYYGNNAFSWRFNGLDYDRTFARYRKWAMSIHPDHAKLIKGLSFEGPSCVEEGVEFEVDIDILDHRPYFTVKVCYDHLEDGCLDTIRDTLEDRLIAALFKQSVRVQGLKLSPQLMVQLGGIFADAMKKEIGAIGY